MRKVFKFGCMGILGLFGFLIIVGLLTDSSDSTETASSSTSTELAVVSTEPTTTPAPTATPTPLPSIGSDVIVDEVRWKVLSAENLGHTLTSDNQFIDDLSTVTEIFRV